ncbi:MAG: AMP-binding protein [Clostridia bacterium]|nr:AMP-binding protein [Clostridia bacterium]
MSNKKYPYNEVYEPKDLKELVEYCAKQYGDSKAFWYREKNDEIVKSFKQVADDVRALGTYLHSIGFHGKHIAIMGENSYEWIISYFAVVNGGNVVVPIDKENVAADVKFQLTQSDAELFLYSDTYADIAEYCDIRSVSFSSYNELLAKGYELIESGDNSFDSTVIDPERMCAIVFTSGTTSEPKGVMLSHKGLAKDAVISLKNLSIPDGTVALLPLYHTFGFMACVLCQMLVGFPVFINTSLKRAFDDIKYAKPKHISVVPMLLIVIYNKIWANVRAGGKEKLFKTMIKVSNALLKVGIDIRRKVFKQVFDAFGGNLEMLITGGSSIDEKYIKGFRDIGITVTNGYGITECSPIVSTMRTKHYAPASVGAIHPELEGRVVDGEVQIKGPTVFLGYYKNEKATAEAFDGEWFKTGDLGSIDEDGLLYIDGRKKNLIILSNGKNVVPEELESLIMNNVPEVKETVVYGENDKIVAEIYPDTEIEGVEDVIRTKVNELNQKLPNFKRMSKVKFTDTEFPKTTTKKIKRTRK